MTYKDTQEARRDALEMERHSCLCDVAEDEPDGDDGACVSLRDLLAQAAALAVKQDRMGKYVGAWVVADAILSDDPEIIDHRARILGIRDDVILLLDHP